MFGDERRETVLGFESDDGRRKIGSDERGDVDEFEAVDLGLDDVES